jgi:uncharacterized protein YrrD
MDLQLQSEKIINQHKHLIIKNINYITEKDILIEVTKCTGLFGIL